MSNVNNKQSTLKLMKLFLSLIASIMIALPTLAQGTYTKQFNDKKLVKTAKKWVKRGAWRNGFTKASPFRDVNCADFYTQYQKNQAQWDAAFKWLAETDLLTIEKGKHPIEGTSLVVSVEDSENRPITKQQSESHYKKIDLQYCVKGIERFAVIEHESSKPNCEYRPDVIHYDYDVAKTRFYDSNPGEFFLFFPGDWHVAKLANDTNDQVIRVIVIKIDYVE